MLLYTGAGSGGLNAAGNGADTIVSIRGNQTKNIKSIIWSYGFNGLGSTAGGPVAGRLVVIDGIAIASAANVAVGAGADRSATGIGQFGGIVKFDVDLAVPVYGGSGEFTFDSDVNDSALQSTGGIFTVLLTAPNSGAAAVGGMVGKLVVAYSDVPPSASPSRTYSYRPVSGPVQTTG